jgi:hypothetical protein
MWSLFKEKTISQVGGMTMNERLYFFGLSDQFENCNSDECRLRIYTKLKAKP